jgi:HEPN domain-containing protein
LAQTRPLLRDLICFHCQQAAEKYLKALLQELGQPVPRTHNLDLLLTQLLPHDGTLRSLRRALVSLSRFAVDYRYPGPSASSRQTQSALRQLARVRRVIRQRLGLAP